MKKKAIVRLPFFVFNSFIIIKMLKPEAIIETIDLGEGRSIQIETGVLAKQADGAVMVRMGDTMLLATVVSAKEAKEDVDFMPLSVDYKEKYAKQVLCRLSYSKKNLEYILMQRQKNWIN